MYINMVKRLCTTRYKPGTKNSLVVKSCRTTYGLEYFTTMYMTDLILLNYQKAGGEMTKEQLEKYPLLRLELALLEKQNASPGRQDELFEQIKEIELFHRSLPDPRQRLVVYLRAMRGLTWRDVAAQMEGMYSKEHLMRLYRDTLKNFL